MSDRVITVEDSLPLMGTDTRAILSTVQQVLEHPGVTRLMIAAGEPEVKFERVATPEEIETRSKVTYHDVIRNTQMEEYTPPEEDSSPYLQLFEMFDIIDDAGFVPMVILSGRSVPRLRKWINISRKADKLYGVKLVISPDIPDDNLIVCGGDTYVADPNNVRYSVKVALP